MSVEDIGILNNVGDNDNNNINNNILKFIKQLKLLSGYLATNQQVTSSIPGTSTTLKVD